MKMWQIWIDLRWFVVDLWWFVVDLWWFVVICGDLWWLYGPLAESSHTDLHWIPQEFVCITDSGDSFPALFAPDLNLI